MPQQQYVFTPYRLDPVNQQLWIGNDVVPLRPKLFVALQHLVENAGRLVTREQLRAAVWPATAVSESVLRGTIRELRDILGDDATAARFIETLPHRGYRFIAPVRAAHLSRNESAGDTRILIGRGGDLSLLHRRLEYAAGGARQTVFITGEPGIGKSAIVDAFLASVAESDDVWVARGQCVAHYGAGEAYLPLLEAMGQFCRQPGHEQVIGLLSRHAPTWLVQLPGLINESELEAVSRRVQSVTRERMLRELADAIDAMTAVKTLVLVLEDLHWSDYSTLDLISLVAQRRTIARLLLLATYRPTELVAGQPLKSLKQELIAHQQCTELPLRFLSDVDVDEYLAARFPQQELPAALGSAIHRRTEGNPLFMVNVVDYWLSQSSLVETAGRWQVTAAVDDLAAGVPETLRQMIGKQLEGLTAEECRTLEVASVAGTEFLTAAVAAGLDVSEQQVEEWCDGLATQGRFLVARGLEAGADGAPTGRYGFIHALYQHVLYERIAPARRARLHQRIGEWAARGGTTRVANPAELAMHFEQAQQYPRAMEYLTQAADNSMRRQAPREAVALLDRSLTLLQHQPESPERAQEELARLVTVGVPLLMTKGYAAPEVERTYARACALCRQIDNSPQLLPALAGLFRFYFVRADFHTARALGEQTLRLAEMTQEPLALLAAHSIEGALFLSLGEFAAAREHLTKSIALYDRHRYGDLARLFGDDPGVTSHCFLAMALWFLGYPDQALTQVETASELAEDIGSAYCKTFALDFVTWIRVLRREEHLAGISVEALMRIAPEQEFPFLLADSKVLHGWIRAAQGADSAALAQMHLAVAAYGATGARMSRPAHLQLLSHAFLKAGQITEGIVALESAHATMEETGERTYEAELHRLRAELALAEAAPSARKRHLPPDTVALAETCYQEAIAAARRQHARSLELRAVTGLSRLWQQQRRRRRARDMLSTVYGEFKEGFDTPDLREARVLLAQLA